MEHVEILASKSAGKQIERSKSGYKPSKIAQKMFADLFGYLMEIIGLGCLVIADCHLDFVVACIIDTDEEVSVRSASTFSRRRRT